MNIKTGSVLFCRSKSFLSNSIRLITREHWSHVAIYLEIEGKGYIVEAQLNGVNLKEFGVWEDKWKYQYDSLYKDVDIEDLKSRALSKCGETKYDIKSIGKHIIKSLTGYWRNEGKKENRKMNCGEFVGYCFYIPEWWKKNPGEVYDYMIENGWS